ncbi:hypothetical protein AB835_05820 [Candidatus Endobugula sertula]|uniref:Uncharacterized protein n=1 Tax=Candidatus Endobugula sertula TaxID=62101 RepID=A0A1D2QR12_9GAMM|nr:hypothetical protein AB835_05820 [Candidatus Endobugula sertula]
MVEILTSKYLEDVLYCLGNERRGFHYFKDRYYLELFAAKPIVKNIIKRCGNGYLPIDNLKSYWPNDVLTFTLTLDRWGDSERGYDQTPRNQQNLVLQINFGNEHNQHYHSLLKPYDSYGPFEYRGHPIRQNNRKTLSWVRIDFDPTTGEALIEEVQNDWIRRVTWDMQRVTRCYAGKNTVKPGDIIHGIDCEYNEFKHYAEVILEPYKRLWAELSLLAAIQFIRNKLGISTIYYHTFDTGRKIKKIYGLLPKSMYTKLPKQFGFEVTSQSPRFLEQHKKARRYLKAIKNTQWYRLSI